MRIIIAGAGEIGLHLAKLLENEFHDVIVIDPDEERLRQVSQSTDLPVIHGSATSTSVLQKARVDKSDLFIAVNPSQNQDMNITSAVLAKQFGAKRTVARINNDEYLAADNKEIFNRLGIDYLLYPEKIAVSEIINLLRQTSTTEYLDFSDGRLQIVVIRLEEKAPIIDLTPADLTQHDREIQYRALGIARDGKTFIPKPDDEFKLDDTVYAISTRSGVSDVLRYTGKINIEVKNMMILGGSPTGVMLAKALEKDIRIKLIDSSRDKCEMLADELEHTLIIRADGRNTDVLQDEDLSNMDAFVALTQNSETNILACMAAMKAGAKKTIADIENLDYIRLAESIGIDTVINKKIIAAGRIFRFTMNSEVQAVKYLTGSEAEVLEFIAGRDSPATRTKVRNLKFPKNAVIGGIVRANKPYIVTGETEIKPLDRVVVFSLNESTAKLGKFFV